MTCTDARNKLGALLAQSKLALSNFPLPGSLHSAKVRGLCSSPCAPCQLPSSGAACGNHLLLCPLPGRTLAGDSRDILQTVESATPNSPLHSSSTAMLPDGDVYTQHLFLFSPCGLVCPTSSSQTQRAETKPGRVPRISWASQARAS